MPMARALIRALEPVRCYKRKADREGFSMSRWTREQRFDMRVLTAVALMILMVSVLMLTVASDMFWGAIG